MGSSLSRQRSATCIDIHSPTMLVTPFNLQNFPELKPGQLTSIDNALWSNLLEKLNPLLHKFRCLIIYIFIATMLTSIILIVCFAILSFRDIVFPSFGSFFIAIWVLLFGTMTFSNLIQERIDSQINEVVAEFNPHFIAKGYTIHYVTLNTGLCKPKRATIERYLEFSAVPSDDLNVNTIAAADIESNHITVEIIEVKLPDPGSLGVRIEGKDNSAQAIVAHVHPGSQGEKAGLQQGDLLCYAGSNGRNGIECDTFLQISNSTERPINIEVKRFVNQKSGSGTTSITTNKRTTTNLESDSVTKEAMSVVNASTANDTISISVVDQMMKDLQRPL